MSDRDDSYSHPTPPTSAASLTAGTGNVAPEDLVCLQSAFEEWEHERERLLARLGAAEGDAHAKLQHAERRLSEALGQLEATKRSAQAVRLRLEAEVQAARTRAREAQEALTAGQTVAEQLRIANAELSTALDATQWRLGELERDALARDDASALAARIEGIEAELRAAHEQRQQVEQHLAATQAERRALEETLEQLRTAHVEELTASQHAAAQHETELLAARDALAHQLAEEQLRARSARDDATALAARIEGIEAELRAAHEQRQQVEQHLAAAQTERRALEETLEQLRTAHLDEVTTWQQAASEHETELLAARDALAHQLAEEQLQARSARDDATALAARIEGIEAELRAAHEQRQQVEQHLAAAQTERRALEETLEQLRTAHVEELTASQHAAAQRETELLAARDALAHQLAEEQLQARSARDDATALAARIEGIEAELRAAHEQRQQVEQHLAAAQAERRALEETLEQLRTAHTDELDAWQHRVAEHQSDRDALASRVQILEDELRQRGAYIEQLRAEVAQLEERQAQALQTAAEVTRREEEWRASERTLREELDGVRRNLADVDAARMAAQQRSQTLEEQLEQHAVELSEAREHAQAAATLARQTAEARVQGEVGATELELRCATLMQQLDDLQKQSTLTEQQHDAMTGRIAELENERSTVALRVDELTALTGELERECDRLRRDRGSSEDTRRLKAENVRLEAKIVELDRQRAEAVRRHSAAVAAYMVELTQRSEALYARETELQKLTEEVELLKQSCEDAVGELTGQRRQQEMLEREIAQLRAAPAPAPAPTSAEPGAAPAPAPPRPSAAPPSGARVSVTKSAKRSAHRDATAGPITVVHLEENKALCDAAREVVARLPDSRYINALDATAPDASGSLLVVNLLSRAHDPVEAIASFIAVDTSHRHVLAYCADGTSGFSFGMADFFAQPIDADACVARLLESRGTIQRLLVVTENFSVVVALRDVLSRMQSSVSSAPDLRQVLELMPMINPDLLLIDLGLPRGEGLRLVSQLRSDPKTRALPLGILLAASGNAADIRQHAQRAARNLPMTAAHLAEALSQQLGVPLAAGAPTTSEQSASGLL